MRFTLMALMGAIVLSSSADAQHFLFANPHIENGPNDGALTTSGRVLWLAGGAATAAPVIDKADIAEPTRTSQSSKVTLADGNDDVVATTILPFQDSLSLAVTLELLMAEFPVGSVITSIGFFGANEFILGHY
jgi:hypothetical protein